MPLIAAATAADSSRMVKWFTDWSSAVCSLGSQMIPNSEQLFTERRLQADVLCTLDRQTVHCVVVHLQRPDQNSFSSETKCERVQTMSAIEAKGRLNCPVNELVNFYSNTILIGMCLKWKFGNANLECNLIRHLIFGNLINWQSWEANLEYNGRWGWAGSSCAYNRGCSCKS